MKIIKYIGRIYDEARGVRDIDRKIFAVYEDGHEESIPERQDLVNHSPTGFCWGYGGSGPAQAALAILAHEFAHNFDSKELGDRYALKHYQDFKFAVIAKLAMDEDFEIGIESKDFLK